MERKRVKGRFVREGLDGDGEAKRGPERSSASAPQPKYCRTFARARIAEALPQIVEKFTEEAAKGSIAHTKVLMKIGGLDTGDLAPKETRRPGKSVIKVLLENLKDLDVSRPERAAVVQQPTAEPDTDETGADETVAEEAGSGQAGSEGSGLEDEAGVC
jgi:hypothetical protein